jgi:hypothetical protein
MPFFYIFFNYALNVIPAKAEILGWHALACL